MNTAKLRRNAQRLLVATTGPAGIAGAHLVLSLMLMASVPAAEFGRYAFLQVMIAFGFGLSNAVFGSPLMVLLNRAANPPAGLVSSYLGVNVLVCTGAAALLGLGGWALGLSPTTAAAMAAAAGLTWWRWFARGYFLALENKRGALVADATYCATLLALAAALWAGEQVGETAFLAAQAVAALASLAALGPTFWRAQYAARHFSWQPFVQGFRQHSGHILVGVSTTEATVNSQAYIITALLGNAAFAPVAAASLIFRPLALVMLSLTQTERPGLAKALRAGDAPHIRRTQKFFGAATAAVYVANVLLAVLVVGWGAPYLLHEPLPPGVLEVATLLVGLRVGISYWRGPASALLQADGQFKPLSHATLYAALITVPLVAVGAWWGGTAWALAGALVGEGVATALTVWYARTKVKV